jgi:dienelactone hydrolase
VGQTDLALDLLDESLEKGYWYGEQVMRQSPSWGVLQGMPRFEAAVQICRARQDEEGTLEAYALYAEPEGGCSDRTCSLFMALHGNGDYAQHSLDGWHAVTGEGWLLAALQSSQAMASGMYLWDDQDTALREIGEQYAATREQFSLDEAQVVIAGFSMGGETALRAALMGTVPARGFVLLGPGGPTIDNPQDWLPLVEQKAHSLRGYVLMGERDHNIEQEAIRELVDLLNANGIPCELEIIPDLVHEYPRDVIPYLRRALDFIVPTRAT